MRWGAIGIIAPRRDVIAEGSVVIVMLLWTTIRERVELYQSSLLDNGKNT